MASARTVGQLVREAALDLDAALILLWDAGLTGLMKESDAIAGSKLPTARAALGLPTVAELSSIDYWAARLGVESSEVRGILTRAGIPTRATATAVQKGGVAVLRQEVLLRTPSGVTAPGEDSTPREPDPFTWTVIGQSRNRPINHLRPVDIEAIHQQLCKDLASTEDRIDTPGVRDRNLLESACSRPTTASGNVLKYPTVEMAVAALTHSLVHNHPFHNGNKRAALVSMLVTLESNELVVTCDQDELFRFIIRVANHSFAPRAEPRRSDREVQAMAEWVANNTRTIQRGDRQMKWHKFRRVLASHGCTFDYPNVGNRINISRVVPTRRWLGRLRDETLRVQVHYGGEGREVEKNTIAHVRQKLMLDEDHQVDSAAFYDHQPMSTDEFVSRYRGVLRQLSRT